MATFLSATLSYQLRIFPAHLMAYYPFRDRLRFPLWMVLLPVGLLQTGQAVLYSLIVSSGGYGRGMSYALSLVYMAIYFCVTRDDRFKVLFLYLLVTDYVLIFQGTTVFLETQFFYRPEMTFDSWNSVMLYMIVNGRLLSSKHKGFGTGTYAVREAAERNGGAAEFTFRDGVFYASVMLYG